MSAAGTAHARGGNSTVSHARGGNRSHARHRSGPAAAYQRSVSGDEPNPRIVASSNNSTEHSGASGGSVVKQWSSFFDNFRPRSKSDAARSPRKPNFISSMRSSLQSVAIGSAAVSLPTSPQSTIAAGSAAGRQLHPAAIAAATAVASGGGAGEGGDGPLAGIRTRFRSESSKSTMRSVLDRLRGKSSSVEQERRKFSKSHSSISSASVNASLYRRINDPPRRRSLSGGDMSNEHNRMAILFRDSRGLPMVDPFVDTINSDRSSREDATQVYVKFFKFHKCYDLIPTSAKLVVFDTMLRVKKAFYALVFNGVRAAPLWDSKQQQFVGMLTITDFIRMLKTYYRGPGVEMEELEEHKLDTWRTLLESRTKPLIYIGPDHSLYDATSILLRNKIHRLPVIDPVSGDVLYIITHKRLLRFLGLYLSELPRPVFMERTLQQLELGTYSGVETATMDTPIITALTKFVTRRVSALPIVDENGRLVHIYAKFDAINLAAQKIYNELNRPLSEAISHRSGNPVECCYITNTLSEVVEQLVRAEVHRLVVVDKEYHVIGVVSLSDILHALIIAPEDYNIKSHKVLASLQSGPSADGSASSHTAEAAAAAAGGGAAADGSGATPGGSGDNSLAMAIDDMYLREARVPILEEVGAEDEDPQLRISTGVSPCDVGGSDVTGDQVATAEDVEDHEKEDGKERQDVETS